MTVSYIKDESYVGALKKYNYLGNCGYCLGESYEGMCISLIN